MARFTWAKRTQPGFKTLVKGMGMPDEVGDSILVKATELLPSGPELKMSTSEHKILLDRVADTLHNDKDLSKWFQPQFLPAGEWKAARTFFKQAAYRWLLIANDKKKKAAEKAKRGHLRAKAHQSSRVEPSPDSDDDNLLSPSSALQSTRPSSSSVTAAWHGLDSSEGAITRARNGNSSRNKTTTARAPVRGRNPFSESLTGARRPGIANSRVGPRGADVVTTENVSADGSVLSSHLSDDVSVGTSVGGDVDTERIVDMERVASLERAASMERAGDLERVVDMKRIADMDKSTAEGEAREEEKYVDNVKEPNFPRSMKTSPIPHILELIGPGPSQITAACLTDAFGTDDIPKPSEVNLSVIQERWNKYRKRRRLPDIGLEEIQFDFEWDQDSRFEVFDDETLRYVYRLWQSLNNPHIPFVLIVNAGNPYEE
ncbi:hypothetical protein H2200_011398 [Cladophialophora chaetospira]|uniref:Uncharacterized protein n=1 Tax=Cladophialophora chaetospira TaxID=386627 RepID=A0AA39CD41_9EURO|nr:hypothetical protein H2200_011398 [Cladophialophora chaetospira]